MCLAIISCYISFSKISECIAMRIFEHAIINSYVTICFNAHSLLSKSGT